MPKSKNETIKRGGLNLSNPNTSQFKKMTLISLVLFLMAVALMVNVLWEPLKSFMSIRHKGKPAYSFVLPFEQEVLLDKTGKYTISQLVEIQKGFMGVSTKKLDRSELRVEVSKVDGGEPVEVLANTMNATVKLDTNTYAFLYQFWVKDPGKYRIRAIKQQMQDTVEAQVDEQKGWDTSTFSFNKQPDPAEIDSNIGFGVLYISKAFTDGFAFLQKSTLRMMLPKVFVSFALFIAALIVFIKGLAGFNQKVDAGMR